MKHLGNIFKILFLFAILFISSCSEGPTGPGGSSFNWPTSTPELQDMNSQLLAEALTQGENKGCVDCILGIRNGYIVAEEYYNGFSKDIPHNVKSVSKSFLSAMTGIALRDGHLDNLNLKMLEFFPEYVYPSIDPRKHDITIKDLLMMRMGIEHERQNYSQIYNTSNWIKTTIEFPLIYDPGSTFSYNTFQTHLLSAIITEASGMSTKDFAEENLLEKMSV